jgi:hypothetical protein
MDSVGFIPFDIIDNHYMWIVFVIVTYW